MKINETLSVLRPAFSAVLLFIAANAHAVGTGTIADGIGSIDKSGNTTTVNQTSHKLIVNWDHMNVGNSDTLNFVQPTSNSAVLNRISLADPTLILGTLNASDRVFIVNPNGVLIGNSAKINVASLIASSLNITDKNFKADRLKFTGGGKGDVINAGEINATESVALIGSKMVVNTGSITSANGDVVLAAADNIRLAFNGPHLQAELSKGSLKALVNNGGLIATQDGNILLTAWARDTLTRSVINNTGVLEASSLTARQSNAPGNAGDINIQSAGNGEVTIGGAATARGWLYAHGHRGTFDGAATADVLKAAFTRQAITTDRALLQANTGRISGGNVDFTRGQTTLGRLIMNVDSADMTLAGNANLVQVYAADNLRIHGLNDIRMTHVTSGGNIEGSAANNLHVEFVEALGDVTLKGANVTRKDTDS